MTIASLGKKYGVWGTCFDLARKLCQERESNWSTIYNYYVDPRKSTWIKSSWIDPIFGQYFDLASPDTPG